MQVRDGVDILKRIADRFAELSPQLQQGARYILDAPDDVAVYSMREIASRAEVKPSTMLRLANRLGYDNYNNLRDEFRKRYSETSSGYAARARRLQLQSSDTGSDLVESVKVAEINNIYQTFETIDDNQLMAAARTIIGAQRVHIVGLRKCFPIACFFQYATRIFFQNSQLLGRQPGMFAEEVSLIGKGDVLLAVSFDPYTRETVEAVKSAEVAGASIVVVTDNAVSPLMSDKGHNFVVANRSPSFYRSLNGALAIMQSLVAAIVKEIGEPAVEALEKSDKSLRNHNTYWHG